MSCERLVSCHGLFVDDLNGCEGCEMIPATYREVYELIGKELPVEYSTEAFLNGLRAAVNSGLKNLRLPNPYECDTQPESYRLWELGWKQGVESDESKGG